MKDRPTAVLTPARFSSQAQRWQAVLRRDRQADGKFYYSVKTTGVYCRPSCASRLARRKNVEFHASCAAAEAAGFRPCKRCQPNGPALEEQHAATVAKACRLIETAETAPKLAALAKAMAMSPFHFHRVFTKIVGLTPKGYAHAHRAQWLRQALPKRNSVTAAIYEAGYNSNSRFYEKSSEMLGMQPQQYRNGGSGATLRFAIGQCSLGLVLVASSEKGVCAIQLGNDPKVLTKELQARFRNAILLPADRAFEGVLSRVVALVERPQGDCDLPLDVRGTAFQQKVWQALREIPAGKTVSYTDIAKRIGMPKAMRAVGRACAENKLAIVIPCHRVRRTDGGLSGYRWGVQRKRALLKKEGALAAA